MRVPLKLAHAPLKNRRIFRTETVAEWWWTNGETSGRSRLIVVAHNTQLQRTVILHRVRAAGAALPLCACGAQDTLERGR
jgi:hypothetical protein